MMKISIVVSYYNSENTFSEFLERLNRTTSKMVQYQFEYVIVDDGSDVFDIRLFDDLIHNSAHSIKIIQLNKNYGQITTVLIGLNHCSGDNAIIMSSDLQDPPELIEKIIITQENTGCEVVGCGRVSRNDSWVRDIGANLWYSSVIKKINPSYPRKGSDYALINRRIINLLIKDKSAIRFIQNEILSFSKATVFIDYPREGKKNRKSEWNFWKMLQLILDIVFTHFNVQRMMLILNVVLISFASILFYYNSNYFWIIFSLLIFKNTAFYIQYRSVQRRLSHELIPSEISKVIFEK